MFQILFLSLCYTISMYSYNLLANHGSLMFITGVRCLASGALILLLHYVYEPKNFKINTKYIKYYIFATLFGFLIPFILGSIVLYYLPAIDTSIIGTIEPVVIYILAAIFFKEKLSTKQGIYLSLGVAISFIAIIIESWAARISLISWQEPISLLMAISFGVGWLIIGRLIKRNESENIILGIGFLTTGAVVTAIALITNKVSFSVDATTIMLLLLTIIFGDIVTTRKRAKLSKKYSSTILSLIGIFSPFIVAAYEMTFNNKQYSWQFFSILIPAMACFIAFYKEEIKQPVHHS